MNTHNFTISVGERHFTISSYINFKSYFGNNGALSNLKPDIGFQHK